MKELKKWILLLFIGLLLFGSLIFVEFNKHHCKKGDRIDNFVEGNMIILECGTLVQSSESVHIKGDEIVRPGKIWIKQNGHIERYKMNVYDWLIYDSMPFGFMFYLLTIFGGIFCTGIGVAGIIIEKIGE